LKGGLELPGLLLHLRVSRLQAPLFAHVLRRPKAMRKSTSLELSSLQHASDADTPFFTLSFERAAEGFRLISSAVPPSGFGYPPGDVSTSASQKASFSFRRSWDSPFKAFFLPADRSGVSPTPSVPALS
jgi:hypothetical protein